MKTRANAAAGNAYFRKDISGIRTSIFPDIAVEHNDKPSAVPQIDYIAHHGNRVLKVRGHDG